MKQLIIIKADGRILSLEYKGSGSSFFGPSAAGNGNQATLNAYDALRQQADRERREKKKIAEPQIQDGRYGFGDSSRDRDRPARPAPQAQPQSNGTQHPRHIPPSNGLQSDKMLLDVPTGPAAQRGRRYR